MPTAILTTGCTKWCDFSFFACNGRRGRWAFGVGHGGAGGGSYFESSTATFFAHAGTQGLLSAVQHGKDAFAQRALSAAAGHAVPGGKFTVGGVVGRTSAAAILGGLTSAALGGDAGQGARRAALVHLFNNELGEELKKLSMAELVEDFHAQVSDAQSLIEKGKYWEVLAKYADFDYSRDGDPFDHSTMNGQYIRALGVSLATLKVAVGGRTASQFVQLAANNAIEGVSIGKGKISFSFAGVVLGMVSDYSEQDRRDPLLFCDGLSKCGFR